MAVVSPDSPRRRRAAVTYARLIARGRWLVVAVWIAGAVAATVYLPSVHTTGGGDFGGLIPNNSAAVKAEKQLLHDFRFPLHTDTAVVVRNSDGLSPLTQLDVVLYAATFDKAATHLQQPLPDNKVLGALPILNTAGVFPTSKESGTTALTYLFFSPNTTLAARTELAHQYAQHFSTDGGTKVAVTGTVPARVRQADLLNNHLNLVEIATLALVTLIVAVTFRSLVAPLVTLAAALLSFLVDIRVLGYVGEVGTLALPPSLAPLVVALVLGILTDYSIFFLTEMRNAMLAGEDTRTSLRVSLRDNIPIVAVAGLTVAAGTGALYAARLQLFQAFGPGLAISVLIGALAAVTFVPAAMAILGRWVYWPSHPRREGQEHPRDIRRDPSWFIRFISHRAGAVVATVLCVGALLAAAYPLLHMKLDLSFVRSLPSGAEARRGADLVGQGFAKGVLAPTTLLVHGSSVTDSAGLGRLQSLLEKEPGVAGVMGPATIPFAGAVPVAQQIFVSSGAPAARYLIFFNNDPLGGPAIDDLRQVRTDLPALLDRAGLSKASTSFAGETAIASEVSQRTVRNLIIVFAVAFFAEFLILAIYLRAIIAPLLLLAASGLVVASALGLATLVFQDNLRAQGLTFYVPFATSVLLIALGSDYNVFGAGRIWDEAQGSRLRNAIRRALPESARAITTAGLTLAGSFALIAIVPLLPFHEMAFTMFVGLLIDTFIVRSVLTPGLLTLLGPAAGWPGHRLRPARSSRDVQQERPRTPAPGPSNAAHEPEGMSG